MIAVRDAGPKGRGVFADRDFDAGETIDVTPTITLSREDSKLVQPTRLYAHCFNREGCCIVPFGPLAMCNHDDEPNAIVEHEEGQSVLKALRDIAIGEEIRIHYSPTGLPK